MKWTGVHRVLRSALCSLTLLLLLTGCQSDASGSPSISSSDNPPGTNQALETQAPDDAGEMTQTLAPLLLPETPTITPLATRIPMEEGDLLYDVDKKVVTAAWAPDSAHLFAGVKDSGLVVIDGKQKTVTGVVGTTTDITALDAHPNGLYLAIGIGSDGSIELVSNNTGLPERAFLGSHGAAPNKLAFDKYGEHLVSCGLDGKMFLWDVQSGQLLQTLYEGSNCTDLLFSPSGLLMIAGFGEEGIVRLWNTETWEMFFSFPVDKVEDIAVNPNGTRLVTASGSREAQVWNLYTGNLLLTLSDPQDSIWSTACSPDGKWIATAGSGRYVYLWDAITGEPVFELEAAQEFIRWLSFSPDGTRLAAAGNVIRLWDVEGLGK